MTSLADVIVNDDEDTGNPDAASTEAVTTTTTTAAAAPSKDENADLPEKFRGKSLKEVVEMYQNLESTNGRMANDLGVQRQLTDRLLDLKRSSDLQNNTPGKKQREQIAVTAADILDRPQETLERVVSARAQEVTEDVNQRLAQMEARLAEQTFINRHPDFKTVVADPTFAGWVQGSAIRLRAAAAANAGNWQIADELLSEFKSSQGGTRKTDESANTSATTADLEGARKASLETSGNAGGKNGTDGKSTGGGKLFRRTELMKLRITDPEAYEDEAFQAEVLKAYHEGRVR